MSTVYIDRKGLELDHEPGVAVLRVGGERLTTIPLAAVERLVVRGAAQVSVGLLAQLWQRRITMLLLGGRRGEVVTMIHGPGHADADIRLRQYAMFFDVRERYRLAHRLIDDKLKAQLRLLEDALDIRPDRRHPLRKAVAGLGDLQQQLAADAGADNGDLSRLLGLEGAAAAACFAGLTTLFPPSLGFTGRNRRPPRDPVNACLSLGYTLLHAEAVRACHIAGLDPLIGFFHQPLAGRESLACDLVEPLRPRLDGWVVELFRERTLRHAHFTTTNGACLLGKAGRQHFYEGYDRWARPVRRLLRLTCRALVRELRGREGGAP